MECNNNLRYALNKYKEITIMLIESLKKDDIDSLDNLFDRRQKEIDKLMAINSSKEQFSEIYNELSIKEVDASLKEKMLEKRNEIKNQIDRFNETKSASRMYSKKNAVDAIFFNKKI